MSAADEHARELFRRVVLADELREYPQLAIIAADAAELPEFVLEHLDAGATTVVVLDDAGQCIFSPEPGSRLRRQLDRFRGRVRARVELRSAHGRTVTWHSVRSRAAFQRELVAGRLIPA